MRKIKLLLISIFLLESFCWAQTVFINEIHYDNVGSDRDEAIEIAGPEGTNLDGWKLVLYNGNGGKVYKTQNLSGFLDEDSDGFGFQVYNISSIQNGSPDGIALVDDHDSVIQFLSYEGSFVAVGGVADGLTSIDIGVSETGSTLVGSSLQLTGTGTKYGDFTWIEEGNNTYEAVNNNQFFSTANEQEVFIHEVQGIGIYSPMEGKTVIVEGIVVGDFQSTLEGFYIQEEDSDADTLSSTSEGIFVYAPGAMEINNGDLVRIKGTVKEFFGLTEINNVIEIELISSGNPLPMISRLSLPNPNSTYLERFEGMYIEYTQPLTITNTYWLGRGGELTLSSGDRLFQPTQIVEPGAAAVLKQKENELNSIIIDDASTQQNPDPVIFPFPEMSFSNYVRGGYDVTNVKGILTYAWSGFNSGGNSTSAYRVYITENPVFDSMSNPRKSQPDDVEGTLKVASINVLNYFNGNGKGGGFPTSRGADNLNEFKRQRRKIINAILAMDVDIIGLMEIENDGYGPFSAIQDLITGINEAGTDTFAFVNPGTPKIGSDEIAVGLLYKTSTISLIGKSSILDNGIDSLFNTDKNRPALAQSFKEVLSGEVITVCVNHFKSKGSPCDDLGDLNTGDGQGNCNITRKKAATALVNWLATDPTNSGSPHQLIIGDLNAYVKEDPIVVIENAGYTNILKNQQGLYGYSYSFGGQWGTLDYAFSSSSLSSFITGATSWHLNADEASVLDYNEEFKSPGQINSFYSSDPHRASDHDPIIVGIEFPRKSINYETGYLPNIGSEWKTIELDNHYNSMVVLASIILPNGLKSKPPVCRIRNAMGNRFEIKVQNPSNIPLSNYGVYYFAVEEGVYNEDKHGIKMEAVKGTSFKTAHKKSWKRETRSFFNSYSIPVVLGQVMSFNDDNWSVFWASSKNRRKQVPTQNSFACGKHVGEDISVDRIDEEIGYVVFEAGLRSMDDKAIIVGNGINKIKGVQNNSNGYSYELEGLSGGEVAIVSSIAMNGNNGGWPVIANDGLSSSSFLLNIDEDQIKDQERRHIRERVAYLVFGEASLRLKTGREIKAREKRIELKVDEAIDLRVFPNPTGDFVTIQSNNLYGQGFISIFSLDGKELDKFSFSANKDELKIKLNLQKYSNGIYVLTLNHSKGKEFKKLVINR